MLAKRYARQLVLEDIDEQGQALLAKARILVIGAGGLGCALLPYLAGAGVGHLSILDPDTVDLSNLHRQTLYRSDDIGQPKAALAKAALLALNPTIEVQSAVCALHENNALYWLSQADIVIDAADQFALTYLVSDHCQTLEKPLISASVLGMKGYVGVFCAGVPKADYRSIFPTPPTVSNDCLSQGVLGTAVGVLGLLQAQMTLALLLHLRPSPLGRLISVDLKRLQFGGFHFIGEDDEQSK